MRKIFVILFAPLVIQAQTWQISPLYPDPVDVCQNEKYEIPISIWNNGTSPISSITVSQPNKDGCPAILFQGSSCLVYLQIDTKDLGFQQNITEFRGSPNYYQYSDYPVNVKACQ